MIKGNLHEVARAWSYICQGLPECQCVSSLFIRTWPAVKCCKSVLLHLILVAIAANAGATKLERWNMSATPYLISITEFLSVSRNDPGSKGKQRCGERLRKRQGFTHFLTISAHLWCQRNNGGDYCYSVSSAPYLLGWSCDRAWMTSDGL